MAMFCCNECGHLFEEGEQSTWKENVGEYGGSPYYEEMSGCPLCKGDYEEVFECKICGSYNCKKGESFCQDCKTNTLKKFQTFLNEFDENEKEILRDENVEWLI